jgi:hypothetical protein
MPRQFDPKAWTVRVAARTVRTGIDLVRDPNFLVGFVSKLCMICLGTDYERV